MTVIPRPASAENLNYQPKFVYLTCKVCGEVFPYSAPKHRYLVKVGKRQETCSRKCSQALRKLRKTEVTT